MLNFFGVSIAIIKIDNGVLIFFAIKYDLEKKVLALHDLKKRLNATMYTCRRILHESPYLTLMLNWHDGSKFKQPIVGIVCITYVCYLES